MSTWEDKIKQFYADLNQKSGFHSVKDLCRGILEAPRASFWEDKEESKVVEWIKDWLEVSECRLKFHNKWIEIHNMPNIVNYEKQEIDKIKELLNLLDQGHKDKS